MKITKKPQLTVIKPSLRKHRKEQERMTIALIDEYHKRLMERENPTSGEYLARYAGIDSNNFRTELNLVTILAAHNKKKQQEWNKLVASGKIKKIVNRILANVT